MSQRNKKGKNLFIDILQGNTYENHRIVINERIFKLNNINRWRLYTKLILQYVNYLHEISDKEIDLFLKDVIKDVKQEAKQFKRKMEVD